MQEVALAPRNAFHGVIAVLGVAAVTAILLGFLLPADTRIGWLLIAFGGVVLLSFAVQLAYARPQGFVVRVSASIVGSLVLMGMVSAAFGVATLVSAF
ncbi:hypothetical protein JF550_12550 [Microbacterium esteraromaticum]|uniref:Uncharacterized protein n=1 Tax=Microbacterium esteraromaticum TaxID=57043 RepID=A0A939ISE1_9MICO|nr:hypothetical protein [Microbacterium esteraromaticum]MBN8206780.1 hypothetical protein [Microbacterium esteraromaticum]MBN8416935.1 hypothetical protein [Microbacterium esteraromaticum]